MTTKKRGLKKKRRYYVDINSFTVDAVDEEEACDIAEQMIRDDIELSLSFQVEDSGELSEEE